MRACRNYLSMYLSLSLYTYIYIYMCIYIYITLYIYIYIYTYVYILLALPDPDCRTSEVRKSGRRTTGRPISGYIYIYIYIHVYIGASIRACNVKLIQNQALKPRYVSATANLCSKILDFRGFDSIIILILRGEFSCPCFRKV